MVTHTSRKVTWLIIRIRNGVLLNGLHALKLIIDFIIYKYIKHSYFPGITLVTTPIM